MPGRIPLELTGLTQDVSDARRAVRRGGERQRARPRRRVRLHPRPLRLRQVDGAVDHRRAAASHAGRRRDRRHRGDEPGRRSRRRLSVAVPAAVADGAPERGARDEAGPRQAGTRPRAGRPRDARSLSRAGRRRRLRRSAARRALARHAAVRVAGARAVARAAVPAARRAVFDARFADEVRAAGHAAAGVGAHTARPWSW